jgi:hypothetical protein
VLFSNYSFNSQEHDDEIAGDGNSMTAEFWQFDARLGRRWNIDLRPNPSVSYYACFENSPIFLQDRLGDSVRQTNAFKSDKELMKAFDVWSKTRQGKKMLKDYGEGGKFEHVALVFDKGDLTYIDNKGVERKRGAEGYTITEFVQNDKLPIDVNSSYESDKNGSVPENIKNTIEGKGKNGDYVKFTLLFPSAGIDLARTSYNILHETQHLRVIQSDIIKFKMYRSSWEQHKYMENKKNGYVDETIYFMFQIRDTWIGDFYKQRKNQFGSPTMENYIWNKTAFWW